MGVCAGVPVSHCARLPWHRHEDFRNHDEAWSPEGDSQGVALLGGSWPH